jgi:hydroxylamine reductase (hybrid-cluster protein)
MVVLRYSCSFGRNAVMVVAILLTLLYLGIKDIRLGPSLPAFITPNVLDFW